MGAPDKPKERERGKSRPPLATPEAGREYIHGRRVGAFRSRTVSSLLKCSSLPSCEATAGHVCLLARGAGSVQLGGGSGDGRRFHRRMPPVAVFKGEMGIFEDVAAWRSSEADGQTDETRRSSCRGTKKWVKKILLRCNSRRNF